jgi:hypothetical protein
MCSMRRRLARIEMRTMFPTKELRDDAVEKYHAIEGGQQTLSNLAAYVTQIVRKRVEGRWPGRCSSACDVAGRLHRARVRAR